MILNATPISPNPQKREEDAKGSGGVPGDFRLRLGDRRAAVYRVTSRGMESRFLIVRGGRGTYMILHSQSDGYDWRAGEGICAPAERMTSPSLLTPTTHFFSPSPNSNSTPTALASPFPPFPFADEPSLRSAPSSIILVTCAPVIKCRFDDWEEGS